MMKDDAHAVEAMEEGEERSSQASGHKVVSWSSQHYYQRLLRLGWPAVWWVLFLYIAFSFFWRLELDPSRQVSKSTTSFYSVNHVK